MGVDYMEKKAFVLRMNIGKDISVKGVESGEIIIGWSYAEGLIDEKLTRWEFREILHKTYAGPGDNYRASGGWAGSMWRFIREMNIGDLVIVPSGNSFYIAQVEGPARYEKQFVADDTAHRRKVKWLNNKEPIPRKYAKSALQSRMKAYQTCVDATDLIDEIEDVIAYASKDDKLNFAQELRQNLIEQTRSELCSGRINDYGFESLAA